MLPNGSGREMRVAVFAEGEKAKEAEDAGADVVGAADLATQIEGGFDEFDIAVATPDLMGVVGKLGRILGPRGKMPNPKTGTVTFDVGKAVREAKAGKLEYRTDRGANVHVTIGKKSFDERALLENYAAVVDEIVRAKPSAAKGRYIRSITLTTTMGPGIKVDPARTREHHRRARGGRCGGLVPRRNARRQRQPAAGVVDPGRRPAEVAPGRVGGDYPLVPSVGPALWRARHGTRGGEQMLKTEKERVVTELVERLRASETLIVADYRGLSHKEMDDVRTELLKAGARFSVVKNTLTRRAAEEAGVEALLELLDGPTAIAFVYDGDVAAVAKTLDETAKQTKRLSLKGGVLGGRSIGADGMKELATLPPAEVLRGQVLGAIVAPLTSLAGLVNAPLQGLVGLIDARIEQLGAQTEAAPAEEAPPEEPSRKRRRQPRTPRQRPRPKSRRQRKRRQSRQTTTATEEEA